jgi:hypothetical protein
LIRKHIIAASLATGLAALALIGTACSGGQEAADPEAVGEAAQAAQAAPGGPQPERVLHEDENTTVKVNEYGDLTVSLYLPETDFLGIEEVATSAVDGWNSRDLFPDACEMGPAQQGPVGPGSLDVELTCGDVTGFLGIEAAPEVNGYQAHINFGQEAVEYVE